MAREDLNPIEEARACAALVEELGLTREEVGLRVGRSRVAVSNLVRLLDLPDEALELLERRQLSEGHGRALLMAPDNATRRKLARQAATGRWSVRELEARARTAEPGERPVSGERPAPRDYSDRQAAAEQIADVLGSVLGADVKVRGAASGFTAQISFSSVEEALQLADRIRS
jgi:ParB family transcriptional regulator, chromosome partitioning protein